MQQGRLWDALNSLCIFPGFLSNHAEEDTGVTRIGPHPGCGTCAESAGLQHGPRGVFRAGFGEEKGDVDP